LKVTYAEEAIAETSDSDRHETPTEIVIPRIGRDRTPNVPESICTRSLML
jgi:hypothetical protein